MLERVLKDKGHDHNGSDTLVFWGWFPSGLCKKIQFCYFFSADNCIIKPNDSTKQDYNVEGFSQYIFKYMALKIWSLKYFEQYLSCISQFAVDLMHSNILAVLDYVSRAYEIEMSVRRPSAIRLSSVRPFVSPLSLNLMQEFLSKFSCCFPWAIRFHVFYLYFIFFLKKQTHFPFLPFFFFSLSWGPTGAKISKRYSYKTQPKLFLYFLPNGSHKLRLGFLKFEILTIF